MMTLFLLSDILSALLLRKIIDKAHKLEVERYEKKFCFEYQKEIPSILRLEYSSQLKNIASLLFLFNPFTILTCVGFSLHSFLNLSIFGLLYCSLHGYVSCAMLCLCLASSQQFYPIAFFFPTVILLHQSRGSVGSLSVLFGKCLVICLLWSSIILIL
eukprot:Sdes_comp20701_c0_seq1m16320